MILIIIIIIIIIIISFSNFRVGFTKREPAAWGELWAKRLELEPHVKEETK